MRLFVAGRDESAGLGEEISRRAVALETHPHPRFLSPQHSALTLRDASTEQDFHDRYLDLLSIRHGVDFRAVPSRAPGVRGRLAALAKSVVWKLVAGRIERIVTRQNTINELIVYGLEMENRSLRAEAAEFRRRRPSAGDGGSPPTPEERGAR